MTDDEEWSDPAGVDDDEEWSDPAGVDDDEEWSDPPMESERDRGRLRVRLACSAVVFLALLAFSGEQVLEVVGMLWPPQSSLARWSTLLLLQLLGYVVLPLLVGGLLGDVVYDRFVDR